MDGKMTDVLLRPLRMLQSLLDLDAGAKSLPGIVRLHPPSLAVKRILSRVEDLVHVVLHEGQSVLDPVPLHVPGQVDAVKLEPPQSILAELLSSGENKQRPREV